jgi:hypothetical protein
VDAFGFGGDLRVGELAHCVAHLSQCFVEGPLDLSPGFDGGAAHLPDKRFAREAPQRVPQRSGEGGLEISFGEPQVVE